MFLGLRSLIYPAPDLDAAKAWYSDVLGSGTRMASVTDPAGFVFGIIENPSFVAKAPDGG